MEASVHVHIDQRIQNLSADVTVENIKSRCAVYGEDLDVFLWEEGAAGEPTPVLWVNAPSGSREYKIPKKKAVTLEWMMSRVEKVFAKSMVGRVLREISRQVIGEESLSAISMYPATYGIGLALERRGTGRDRKRIEAVGTYLEENGIVFGREVSEGRWVYRFRLSTQKENIDRLLALVSLEAAA